MKNKADIRWTYILMILTLGLGACSVMDPLVGSSGKEGGGWIDWDGEAGWSDSAEPAAEGVAAGADSFAELPAAEPPVELEEAAVGAVKLESEPASGSQAPNLRAGSVDDNAEWDDYLLYRLRFTEWGIDVHDVDVTGRHTITVSNAQGQPVLGAEVTVLDENGDRLARLTTHSDGSVLFFPNAYPESDLEKLEIVVAKDGREVSQVMDREDLEHAVTLDAESSTQPLRLDVHFLIDATGSMSDEIAQLKENMIAVSEQIEALPSNPRCTAPSRLRPGLRLRGGRLRRGRNGDQDLSAGVQRFGRSGRICFPPVGPDQQRQIPLPHLRRRRGARRRHDPSRR
ncbi:MAG: hypothetical protein P8Z42_01565 [Anaerolineales bacterium]